MIRLDQFQRGFGVFIRYLQSHSTDGVGKQPIHLDKVFVLDKRLDAFRSQPHAEQMGFFRFGESGDRRHGDGVKKVTARAAQAQALPMSSRSIVTPY